MIMFAKRRFLDLTIILAMVMLTALTSGCSKKSDTQNNIISDTHTVSVAEDVNTDDADVDEASVTTTQTTTKATTAKTTSGTIDTGKQIIGKWEQREINGDLELGEWTFEKDGTCVIIADMVPFDCVYSLSGDHMTINAPNGITNEYLNLPFNFRINWVTKDHFSLIWDDGSQTEAFRR